MSMHYQANDPIILGSGELYIGLASEIDDLSELTALEEAALVNIGAIESGANVAIETEKKEIKSSNRGLIKKIAIDKSVKFSTGVMTWVLKSISDFLLGSTYTENEGIKKMIVGLEDESPIVYLRFVHKKKTGGTLTVNIYKAQFDGELNFIFDNENPTTINYEFVGLADDDLNYIEFIEIDE